MKCPHCGELDTKVLDTRVSKDSEIRRRRECLDCNGRFTTVETVLVSYPYVLKKDGRREAYDPDKLRRGLQLACMKQAISLPEIERIVSEISQKVLSLGEKEISAQIIGHLVMEKLKILDDVAYVRFASVYKTFKDVKEFVETLEEPTKEIYN